MFALSNLAPRSNRRIGPSSIPLKREPKDDDFWATHTTEKGSVCYSFLIKEGDENILYVYGGWPLEYPMFSFSMEQWVDVSELENKFYNGE